MKYGMLKVGDVFMLNDVEYIKISETEYTNEEVLTKSVDLTTGCTKTFKNDCEERNMIIKKYKLYDLSDGFKFVGRYATMKDLEKGAKIYRRLNPNCKLRVYKYRTDLDTYELMVGDENV